MYPVSADFQEAIKLINRDFALKLEIETAFDTFNLTDADMDMKSLKLEEGCATGSTLTLGAAKSAIFDIALNNRDGRYDDVQFNGGIMRPVIGLELPNGNLEWVPLGVFNIDEVSRPTTSVSLGGSDNLILLDRAFADVPITFPCTHAQLLVAICNTCGVQLMTPTFLNSGHVVQEAPDGTPSCRDVVKCIAELAAGYAQCDRTTGALKIVQYVNPGCVQEANLDGNVDSADGGDFQWYNTKKIDGGAFYTPPPAVDLGPGNRYDFKIDDNPVTIMGIVYEAQEQDYVVGDRTYALHISDNALIQGDPAELLNSIADVMIGFTYLPYTSNWQGNPALQPGDIVRQTDRNGVPYLTLVTNSSYIYRGNCILSAKGASQIAAAYQSKQSKKETQLLRLIHQKQVKIDSLDQAILTATNLIAGALGGYAVQGTGQYEGNTFIADNPDITKAAKLWRWNLGGFGYSEHGVGGPYATAITADGSIVANALTARIITGDMIRASTITGDNIAAGTITAAKIAAGAITADKISAGAITGDMITSKKIQSSNGQVYFDLDNNKLTCTDIVGVGSTVRATIGSFSSGSGTLRGLGVFDGNALMMALAKNPSGYPYFLASGSLSVLADTGSSLPFVGLSNYGVSLDAGVGNSRASLTVDSYGVHCGNGVNGSFTASNGKTYTFTEGILTNVS